MSTSASIQLRPLSYYKNAKQNDTDTELTMQEVFDGIALGRWQKNQEWVRDAPDKDHPKPKGKDANGFPLEREYDRRKRMSPGVTLAGAFTIRNSKEESLREASGAMGIDLDHLGNMLPNVAAQLRLDPFVLAVFISIGGDGLCVVFRVDANRWLDSFEGIQAYMAERYALIVNFDASVKDKSRLRFVSYDPDIYVNFKVPVFKKYVVKAKKETKPRAYIHTDEDIEFVVQQIESRNLDITLGDGKWVRIGMALINQYGENGRGYFHRVCQFHPDYDADEADKKYDYWSKCNRGEVRIGTFYYLCREAGLDIMTQRTKLVVSMAAMHKKQGGTVAGTVDTLQKMENVSPADAEPIVKQVFESREGFQTDESLFDQIELFLRQNYPMRYNEVKRDFEDGNGAPLEDHHYYAIYIHARRVLGEKVRYEDMYKIIHSRTVCEIFHPFLSFFNRYKNHRPIGVIQALSDTIDSDTNQDEEGRNIAYVYLFLRKWLIGLIGSIYGTPCDLVPVLTGADGIGKTWFFRLLLPDEWKPYFLDSKWVPGKDEDVDMCKHIIAFNDEFKGRDTKDMEYFKALTSKESFSIREVYTRKSVKMRRLAVLCATSNHKGVINEPEFNRRIIPINVLRIDFEAYNAIDKIDLIMEAYHAYMNGERYTLTKVERQMLGQQTEEFQNKSIERQAIEQYLKVPTGNGGENAQFKSTIDILTWLELRINNRKLDDRKLGRELQACKFIRKQKRTADNKREWGYEVILLE